MGKKNGFILYLTTADTEILAMRYALEKLPGDFGAVRCANIASFATEADLQHFLGSQPSPPWAVLLRLLGGRRAFEKGLDTLRSYCVKEDIPLIACPGEQHPDPELAASSTVPLEVQAQAHQYLVHGGVPNLVNLLLYLSRTLRRTDYDYDAPRPLPWEGLYRPGEEKEVGLETYLQRYVNPRRPSVALLFYRAHWLSHNLDFVDALVEALEREGCNVLPLFCYSLRDQEEGMPRVLRRYLLDEEGRSRVDVVVSTLSFAATMPSWPAPTPDHQSQVMNQPEAWRGFTAAGQVLKRLDVPFLQAVAATSSRAEWEENPNGLSPVDTAMNVALPEFDGRIITVPISFKEILEEDPKLGTRVLKYVPHPDRVAFLARLAANFARLRRKPNREKRLAIVLSNYPSRNARIGNAVGLDTPASVVNLLHSLAAAGYQVGPIPENGDALMQALVDHLLYDPEAIAPQVSSREAQLLPRTNYEEWFRSLPPVIRQDLTRNWGEPPGQLFCVGDALAFSGIVLGNIFIGVQPPRGFGENSMAIYHSPDLPPTHHYLAFYHWLRDVFRADAVIHMGKHGTLEWLPGKGLGLSSSCYPELALQDLPLFYPFIVNDPGEGAQAKRRAHAVIIDHLTPPMTTAEAYGELLRIEQLMDEYYEAQVMDPKKLPLLREQLWQALVEARLHRDLGVDSLPQDFDRFLLRVDGYLCELKDAQIRGGLHILGQAPQGEGLIQLLLALTRLDNLECPSLRRALAEALDITYDCLLEEQGLPFTGNVPPVLAAQGTPPIRSRGDVLEAINRLAARLLRALYERGFDEKAVPDLVARELPRAGKVPQVLEYICRHLYPQLMQTSQEITHLLQGLEGGYVLPGPSGAPTRGMAHVLPTGRNFYAVDPNTIPSPAAWEVGKELGNALLEKYLREEGRYPEAVGLILWGSSTMRTHGEDVAQVLWLLGVRPVWQPENRHVRGLEVIPLEELGRPRIDVTVRISGFFRDAFLNLVHLLDQALELVANLDEPPDWNYLARNYRNELSQRREAGVPEAQARELARYRIFGSKPGSYGAGILPLLHSRNWRGDEDLASVYIAWGSYAYSRKAYGEAAPEEFRKRFRNIVVAVKNQDNREHDIFDSDDYLQYHGGMIAAVRALTGHNPKSFFGDSSDPSRPKVRDLADEARRVFRTRVVNPRWLQAMMEHGYKGALEMAATVDYIFGYDATAQVVEDWMYQRLAEAYVLDPQRQQFLREKNPWALRDIIERLLEAVQRGMWSQPPKELLDQLRQVYLSLEGDLEARYEQKA